MRTEKETSDLDEIWEAAVEAMEFADKVFAKAEKVWANMPKSTTTTTTAEHDPRVHTLRFSGHWRLFKKFIKLAFCALFTGKAEIKFQKSVKEPK